MDRKLIHVLIDPEHKAYDREYVFIDSDYNIISILDHDLDDYPPERMKLVKEAVSRYLVRSAKMYLEKQR